jgi:hypothetical protein
MSIDLEVALGKGYKSQVEGVMRNGSKKNPQGYSTVDFEGGSIFISIKIDENGNPFIYTMFAKPK